MPATILPSTSAATSPTLQARPTAVSKGRGRSDGGQIVVGTRGSALALWQTEWVLDGLRARWPRLECVIEAITTSGDRTQTLHVPLTQLGDKSMFVAELEQALLAGALDATVQPMNDRLLVDAERIVREGEVEDAPSVSPAIDAAVHSLKDLPGMLDKRLMLAAVPEREDPRDALISRSGRRLAELPPGAVIATGSLRRRAQLLHLRPDLQVAHIRGNVDTRLRKAMAPDGPDGVILAVAGLKRLELEGSITEILPVETLVPAVGQGALAVEIRTGDVRLRRLLRPLDHSPTRKAVLAERAVLAALGGGCQVPLGAHARVSPDGERLRLIAVVASLDGQRLIRVEHEGPIARPATLGRAVARELLRSGASLVLREILDVSSGAASL